MSTQQGVVDELEVKAEMALAALQRLSKPLEQQQQELPPEMNLDHLIKETRALVRTAQHLIDQLPDLLRRAASSVELGFSLMSSAQRITLQSYAASDANGPLLAPTRDVLRELQLLPTLSTSPSQLQQKRRLWSPSVPVFWSLPGGMGPPQLVTAAHVRVSSSSSSLQKTDGQNLRKLERVLPENTMEHLMRMYRPAHPTTWARTVAEQREWARRDAILENGSRWRLLDHGHGLVEHTCIIGKQRVTTTYMWTQARPPRSWERPFRRAPPNVETAENDDGANGWLIYVRILVEQAEPVLAKIRPRSRWKILDAKTPRHLWHAVRALRVEKDVMHPQHACLLVPGHVLMLDAPLVGGHSEFPTPPPIHLYSMSPNPMHVVVIGSGDSGTQSPEALRWIPPDRPLWYQWNSFEDTLAVSGSGGIFALYRFWFRTWRLSDTLRVEQRQPRQPQQPTDIHREWVIQAMDRQEGEEWKPVTEPHWDRVLQALRQSYGGDERALSRTMAQRAEWHEADIVSASELVKAFYPSAAVATDSSSSTSSGSLVRHATKWLTRVGEFLWPFETEEQQQWAKRAAPDVENTWTRLRPGTALRISVQYLVLRHSDLPVASELPYRLIGGQTAVAHAVQVEANSQVGTEWRVVKTISIASLELGTRKQTIDLLWQWTMAAALTAPEQLSSEEDMRHAGWWVHPESFTEAGKHQRWSGPFDVLSIEPELLAKDDSEGVGGRIESKSTSLASMATQRLSKSRSIVVSKRSETVLFPRSDSKQRMTFVVVSCTSTAQSHVEVALRLQWRSQLQGLDCLHVRNPDGRVTDNVIRDLVAMVRNKGVMHCFIVHHTCCGELLEKDVQSSKTGYRQGLLDDMDRLSGHSLLVSNNNNNKLRVYGVMYDERSQRLIDVSDVASLATLSCSQRVDVKAE